MIERNHEYYVSLEVAKLLKQAGFDWETNNYYEVNEHIRESVLLRGYNNSNTNWNAKQFFMSDSVGLIFVNNGTYLDSITGDYVTSSFFSAPTLDIAQRWLREVKDVDIAVHIDYHYGEQYSKAYYCPFYIGTGDELYTTEHFKTYEEALEAGIKKALKLLLEKGE